MASSREGPRAPIDRQTTAPFHLKLFYRVGAYNSLSDYSIPVQPRRDGPVSGPNSISPSPTPSTLPQHLEIYTWQSCTLRELAQLLTSALPKLLPSPPIGTRLCFRLIYPDARGAAMSGPHVRGEYLSRDLGSVIVSPRTTSIHGGDEEERTGNEADKPLHDERFIVGDYIECAILPPLEDGSVAPVLGGGSGPMGGARGGGRGGMRAFRDNGFGGYPRGPRGSGRGVPRGGGDRGPPIMPHGDWNRGERLPDGGRRGGGGGSGGGGGGGGGRRGWAPY
ncbi:unnamed protein product [Penicillium bialowiezense]